MALVFLENNIIVLKKGLSEESLDKLGGLFTYINPNFNPSPPRDRPWEKDLRKHITTFQETSSHLFLPSGSLIKVNKFFKTNKLNPIYVDKRVVTPPIDIQWNREFKLWEKYNQKEAVLSFLRNKVGIVSKPCGTGKTIVGIYLISLLKQKTAILVNKRILVEQWKKFLKKFCKFDFPIGYIGGGEFNIQPITIIMKQTQDEVIFNEGQADQIRNEFGFVIVDEVHHVATDLFISGVSIFNTRYKLGLSATPYRKDKLEFFMFDYVGPIIYQSEREDTVKMEVEFREDGSFSYGFGRSWVNMVSSLARCEDRNQRIISDVVNLVKEKYCVAIMSRRIKQCQYIYHSLLKQKVNARLLIGSTPKHEQEAIVEDAEKGLVDVIVGSIQIFSEGVDIPPLSCIMLITPENNKRSIEQCSGRGMREWEGKNPPLLIYYVDVKCPILSNVSRNVRRWCSELKIDERKR